MGNVLFADVAGPVRIEKLDGGGVRVRARLSRTGIQTYAPWPGSPITDRPIKVYRPPEQVFDSASLKTIKSIPVTIGHPAEKEVTADTWKKYAVGHVEGHEVVKSTDGGEDFIETSIVLSDADAMKRVLDDKSLSEISQGYFVDLKWGAGTTPGGKPFDAIQTAIIHNHTALLESGQARAGQGARVLLDSSIEENNMPISDEQMKKIKDDIRKEINDENEVKAEEDKKVADAKAAADMKEADEKTKIEADAKKTAEQLVADKAEREKGAAEAKELLDQASDNSMQLLDTRDEARSMLDQDYDFKGKSVREIRIDCIEKCLPKLELASDASDERVLGIFETLKASGTKYVKDTKPREKSDHVKAFNERNEKAFADSWGTN